jgi:hypothetical protein
MRALDLAVSLRRSPGEPFDLEAGMRTGAVLIVIWLVIGALAAYQRGYFSGDAEVNCAELTTVLITIVVGPLNYVGLNPQIECTVPQPSS